MIAYVGIDAHTTNYTLSTCFDALEAPVNTNTYPPSIANIVKYCNAIKKQHGNDTEIIVGYEAGSLGFELKRKLEKNGLKWIEYKDSCPFFYCWNPIEQTS